MKRMDRSTAIHWMLPICGRLRAPSLASDRTGSFAALPFSSRRGLGHPQLPDGFAEVMNINAGGVFNACRAAMRFRREEDIAGNIVNVSSLAGIKGMQRFAGFAAYAASKHAVVGLTEALALEGKPYGIRVNAIAPGTLRSPMSAALGLSPTYNARGDRPHGGVLARPNPFRRALRRHHRDPLQ